MAEPVSIIPRDDMPVLPSSDEGWRKMYPGLKVAPPPIGTIVFGKPYLGGDPRVHSDTPGQKVWGKPVTGEAWLNSFPDSVLPPEKKEIIRGLAKYELAPGSQKGGLGTPEIQAYLAHARMYDPTFTSYNYSQRQNARKSFLIDGINARTKIAMNTALGHAGELDEKADELGNYGNPGLNFIKNNFDEVLLGDPRQGNFRQIATNLGNETVKAVTGGEGAESDRQKAADVYKEHGSLRQQRGAIKTTLNLFKPKLQEMQDAFELAYGPGSGKYPFLSPVARATYDRLLEKYKDIPVGGNTPSAKVPPALPPVNAQGWTLHHDNKGVFAYVSPDGKQAHEVKP